MLGILLAGSAVTARAALGDHPDPSSLFGIGAVLSSAGDYPRIAELVPGGAAERDGHLKVNDRIAGVAQGDAAFVDCSGLALDKIVEMVRGNKGTTVRLQVIPAGADFSKRVIIPLVRAEIKIQQTAGGNAGDQDAAIDAGRQSKLDDAVKKIAEGMRKLLADDTEKEIDRVVQVTALDAAGRKALEAAYAAAVDQCMEKSEQTLADELRTQYKQVPAALMGMLFARMGSNSEYAKMAQTQIGNWPADQPAWKDGLKQTLSPQQASAWDTAEAKRKQAAEQEIGDFLKGISHFAEEQMRPQLKQKVSRIQAGLNLPKDRLVKLNAEADTLLDQYGASASARAEKGLLAMSDDERKKAETAGRVMQGFAAWLQPAPVTEWDAALEKLLTPEEINRLQTVADDRKARRAGAMGQILVALLDEKIAFTAAQRQQLEPIAQSLVKAVPDLMQGQDMGDYFNFSVSNFYGALSGASAADIQAILDPIQWRHWQEAAALKNMPDPNMYIQVAVHLPAIEDADKPRPIAEPGDIDRVISDFLEEKSRAQQQVFVAQNVVKAEDIARVVHLPDAASAQLQTAARGSAESLIDTWNANAERMVHSVIGDASPDTVKARLDSIQNYQFQQLAVQSQMRNLLDATVPDTVWDKTLKAVLTPDQQAAWKKETDARAAYRQKAIGALIVAAFDQRTGLSADQWAKLEPLVDKFLDDYGQELGGQFMFSQAWFLQSDSIFIPIAGIPDAEMKSILTTDQWDHWTGSNEYTNASQYWSNLSQNHQQRARINVKAR